MQADTPTSDRTNSDLSSCGSIVRALSFARRRSLGTGLEDMNDVLNASAQQGAALRFAAAQLLLAEHLTFEQTDNTPPPPHMPSNSNVRNFSDIKPMPTKKMALSPITPKSSGTNAPNSTPPVPVSNIVAESTRKSAQPTEDFTFGAFNVSLPATIVRNASGASENSAQSNYRSQTPVPTTLVRDTSSASTNSTRSTSRAQTPQHDDWCSKCESETLNIDVNLSPKTEPKSSEIAQEWSSNYEPRASSSDTNPSPRTEPKSSDVTLNIKYSAHRLSSPTPSRSSSSDSLRHGALNIARPVHCNFEKAPSRSGPSEAKVAPTPSDYSFDSPSEVERDIPQMIRNRSGLLRFLMPRVSSKRTASAETPTFDTPLFAHKRSSLPSLRDHRMDSTATREERATIPTERPNNIKSRGRRIRNLFSALRITRRSTCPVPDRADQRGKNFSVRTKLSRSRASTSTSQTSSVENSHNKMSLSLDIPAATVVQTTRGDAPVESSYPRATVSPSRAPLERPQRRVPLSVRQPVAHEWTELMPRSSSSTALYGLRELPVARSSSGTTMRTVSMPKPPDTIPRRRTDMARSTGFSGVAPSSFRMHTRIHGDADTRKVRMPGGGVETIVSRLPVESVATERQRRKRPVGVTRRALLYSR